MDQILGWIEIFPDVFKLQKRSQEYNLRDPKAVTRGVKAFRNFPPSPKLRMEAEHILRVN